MTSWIFKDDGAQKILRNKIEQKKMLKDFKCWVKIPYDSNDFFQYLNKGVFWILVLLSGAFKKYETSIEFCSCKVDKFNSAFKAFSLLPKLFLCFQSFFCLFKAFSAISKLFVCF